MTDLVLRKIPFNFDGVELLRKPDNPTFSMMMNGVTFQAIGFEKYMCLAMRDAEKYITDPAILEDARLIQTERPLPGHCIGHCIGHCTNHCSSRRKKSIVRTTRRARCSLQIIIEL